MQADIAVEASRAQLLQQQTANERLAADAQGYVTETTLRPFQTIDWRTLTALQNNPNPRLNIALAFRELAENAGKIGTLNITPDLLDGLLRDEPAPAPETPKPSVEAPTPPKSGRR